ncbi:hypothetical protein Leryth_001250 [Lithospermum erythrorhizon]|nr:hypothetical protein Leryth_001250 [Lithospermum erythrorhizon]
MNKQVRGKIIRKRIHVRVEHVQPSRCTEEVKNRIKKNDQLKAEEVGLSTPKNISRNQQQGALVKMLILKNEAIDVLLSIFLAYCGYSFNIEDPRAFVQCPNSITLLWIATLQEEMFRKTIWCWKMHWSYMFLHLFL